MDQKLPANNEENQYEISKELINTLVECIDNDDTKSLKEHVNEMHVADIANFISFISSEKRKAFVESYGGEFDPEVLLELKPDIREEVIDFLGAKESAEVIKELETDDAVDIIEDLNEKDQQEILGEMSYGQRIELESGLSYPENSAGRLIDKNIVTVPEYWTVGQTIDYLRSEQNLPDDFYQLFVVDPKFKPTGGVKLSHIMRSKREVKISDIMYSDLKVIPVTMDQEDVAYIFTQYDLSSAPVVNEEGRMIGLIDVDDIVEIIEEEAQEDIMHLGGVSETDFYTNFSQTIVRRFPWLMINLVTAVIASIVIWVFEGTIEKLAALAVLMPIVASMGGNAGTQTITIAVRALATKDLTSTNALRVVGKEVLVGVINGFVFGLMAAIFIYMWYDNLMLSLIFGVATIFTLLLAGFAGAIIPLGLEKIGVDPAIASGVVLTTVTDVVAFGAFLGMAALILL